jgi:glycosyltransferase involved in cell wall biosynthesis
VDVLIDARFLQPQLSGIDRYIRNLLRGLARIDSPLEVEQLAEAIARVLEDNDLSADLVAAGRARVTRLTPAAQAEQTLAIYRQLLEA